MSLEDTLASLGDATFTDPDFPAEAVSLMPDWESETYIHKDDYKNWRKIQWLRASEIKCLKDSEGG